METESSATRFSGEFALAPQLVSRGSARGGKAHAGDAPQSEAQIHTRSAS